MPENTPNEIKNTALENFMERLAASFERRSDLKFADEIEKAFEDFPTLPSPRDFHYRFKKDRDTTDAVVRNLLKRENKNNGNLFRSQTIYEYYSFFDSHMRRKIAHYEGSGCSVDKLSSVLRWFVRNDIAVANGEPTVFETVKEDTFNKWYFPQAASIPLWFDFVNALVYLHAGDEEKYIKSLIALEQFYSTHEFVEQGS